MDINNTNHKIKFRLSSKGSDSVESDQLSEQLLILVFESIKWDIHTLCHVASSSRKMHAIARRILWRSLCVHRAPHIASALGNGGSSSRLVGGWHALAKLLFFCPGCESTRYFPLSRHVLGHFVKESRFSKTSGKSFLMKKCKGDLLYVTDPCEHPKGSDMPDDLGVFRGVFKEFIKSKTRSYLVARQVALEESMRCTYCGVRVWSMTRARLMPKSAAKRLGSHGDRLEFFVCVNGHLFGTCWLIPLSSDEGDEKDSGTDGDDDDDGFGFHDPMARNGVGNGSSS